MEPKRCCNFCGKELAEEYVFDGIPMCRDCYEAQTVICSDCGERMWVENAECVGCRTVCRDCYDNYVCCEVCGMLMHPDNAVYEDDSDVPYCSQCYENLEQSIRNYSYKPHPLFYGKGDIYIGVELEIDDGGEINANAQQLLDIANEDNYRMYCKHDGSINDGFEMVSHPMTLEYHQKDMVWREIFEKAISMDYRSHQTQTCGLHTHINRDGLGKTEEEQEDVISRIVYFVEKNWNELLLFSRRTEASIQRWASRYGISENTKDTYKKAKDKHLGRYVAVNLENQSTIEFRLFRGTLRYETFIATLQLVENICRTAIELDDEQIESMSWCDFVVGIKNPELIEYLKSKRLYV